MKNLLRNLFSPLLNIFESGNEAFIYKKSHRTILIVMGILFTGLASLVFTLAQGEDISYLIPVFVFGGAGLISLIIGTLGNDRAVSKIWGSGNK